MALAGYPYRYWPCRRSARNRKWYTFTVPASATKQAYSRAEVCRKFGVSAQQLRAWERQNLISSTGSFSFSDILALRTLIALRASKIPAAQIRQALHALRTKLKEYSIPLTEVKIYSQGRKIQVQFAGQKMEPISGQLLLDFDRAEINKLTAFPGPALKRIWRKRSSRGARPNTGLNAAWSWSRPALRSEEIISRLFQGLRDRSRVGGRAGEFGNGVL